MQAPIVNPYVSIPAATGAKDATAGDSANGQAFSAMLGDAQLGADDSASQDHAAHPDHLSEVSAPVAGGVLAAQEVDEDDALQDFLSLEVGPENIADLIADLDLAMQQGSDADKETLQALKNQLLAVQKNGETTTVAALMQQVGAAQPQALADAGAGARMLHWLQTALARKNLKQELSTQDTASAATTALGAMSAAMQGLQAGLFRPDAPADTGSQDAQQKGSEESGVIISFIPLAQVSVVPVSAEVALTAVSASAAESLVPVNVAAPVEKDLVADTLPPLDIDAAIPPLDSAPAEAKAKAASLPEVELPRFADPVVKDTAKHSQAKTQAESATPMASAATGNPTLAAQIQSISAVVAPHAQTAADDNMVAAAATNNGVTGVDAVANAATTSASNGAVPTQTADAVQATSTTSAGHHKSLSVPVSEQVHVAIKQAAGDGTDKITIQLDPIDLGRVEVKMQVAQDGQTQISFTVDKPSTFDALSRDVRSLERSLQDAGIKADAGSMQFNLRQSPQQMQSNMGGQGQSGGQHQRQARADEEQSAVGAIASAAATKHYSLNMREGVDIRA